MYVYKNKCTYGYTSVSGPAVRVFANGPETWVQSQVESYQRL